MCLRCSRRSATRLASEPVPRRPRKKKGSSLNTSYIAGGGAPRGIRYINSLLRTIAEESVVPICFLHLYRNPPTKSADPLTPFIAQLLLVGMSRGPDMPMYIPVRCAYHAMKIQNMRICNAIRFDAILFRPLHHGHEYTQGAIQCNKPTRSGFQQYFSTSNNHSGSYPGPSPAIYRAFQTQALAEDTTKAVDVSPPEATVSNDTGVATQKKLVGALQKQITQVVIPMQGGRVALLN